MTSPQFIILHEKPLQSWLRDASSLATFVVLIGIGVALDSAAMQWAGFLIAVIIVCARAVNTKTKRMTREEAIAYLQGGESA